MISGVGFRGFVYENGKYTELSPLSGGAWSGACAINSAGKALGFRSISKGVNPFNAFIWSAMEGFNDLGVMNGPNSSGLDLNEAGDAVGWTGSNPLNSSAFFWHDGVVVDIGFIPGGFTGVGFALNDLQQVVVSGLLQEGGETHVRSFLWDTERMVDLGVLPGYHSCAGLDVNNIRSVVGFCSGGPKGGGPRAFLWDGVIHDLNDLLEPGSPITLERGSGINDSGQIVGDAHFNGFRVAFVLSPIASPVGDINIDCEVDADDLVLLLDHFGQVFSPADLNSDGVVNVLDLIVLLLNFGL